VATGAAVTIRQRMSELPAQQDAQQHPVEPEETVHAVPVLSEVRALEPARPAQLPVAKAAAVAMTGFVAGAATVVAINRRTRRRLPARAPRRAGRRRDGDSFSVLGTRSFLLDVHLLGRGE
jgi:hypothetical protein